MAVEDASDASSATARHGHVIASRRPPSATPSHSKPLPGPRPTSLPNPERQGKDTHDWPAGSSRGRAAWNTFKSATIPSRETPFHVNRLVVLKSFPVNGKTIPAPDRRIDALHAVCVRIAQMSGAAGPPREFCRDTGGIAGMTQPNAAYESGRALRTLQLASASAYHILRSAPGRHCWWCYACIGTKRALGPFP